MKLDGLSASELTVLLRDAGKRLAVLRKRKPAALVRSRVAALLKKEGYTIGEVFGGVRESGKAPARPAAKKPRGAKIKPKYRNPENADETWTGRGRAPRWLAAKLASGRSLEEFVIRGEAQ